MSIDQINPVSVGILGYGTIGRRLATAVSRQPGMRLVGVANHFKNLGRYRHDHPELVVLVFGMYLMGIGKS